MKIIPFACWLIAAICFFLVTLGINAPRVNLQGLGLLFLTIGAIAQYGI